MLRNYLTVAFRNLVRNKLFTGLNILGLATGLACSMFIFLWVQDEVSYDRFNTNADKIYRITAKLSDVQAAVTPPPLSAAIEAEIPAIKNATRIIPLHKMITAGTKKFDERNIYYALNAMLGQHPGMGDYTITDHLPTYLTTGAPLHWPGMDPQKQVIASRLRTDENFIKTFGMQLIAGRFFSDDFKADDSSYVVNETALKAMGMTTANAIGKKITLNDREGPIIGVVKDFNFKPIQQPIEPLVIRNNFAGGYLVMRTSSHDIRQIVEQIKDIFGSIYAGYPFSYGFVNEDLSKLYLTEQRMGKLFTVFSVLSIIISSLGLLGLTTYAVQRRTKEIGIRKVLGASVTGVTALLSKEFIKLVLIATAIAIPVAWYAVNSWLQDFAYRIEFSWWMFALAGLLAVVIALMTVSIQSVKAALANPVRSLRSE